VIDVGHTPDGIRQSLASLKAIHGADDWILVIGISFDKKADEIAALLASSFGTIVCTAARHKGASAAGIAASVQKANPDASVQIAATIEDAVGISQRLATTRKQKIYVAGGLFLAIEYATIVRGGRAQDLDFF
jgi:dihydrofolate synthase / folylpolyglutamate synthase